MPDRTLLLYGGAGLVVVIALIWITRKGNAESAGRVAAGAIGAAAVGAVKGIGELVGIPDTNMTECQKAIAEGRWWDASFACPALEFLRAVSAPAAAPFVGDLPLATDAPAAPPAAWSSPANSPFWYGAP